MVQQATYSTWERFVIEGKDISDHLVRPVILDSWNRSRGFGVDPHRNGCRSVEPGELARRRGRHARLREVAIPYIKNLYKLIEGSGSLISLADEDGVILDVESDESIKCTKNFPFPGTIHSEDVIGTNGMGTALMIDGSIQVHAEEHWMVHNHCWSCSTATIHENEAIVGCLNLSCPMHKAHEHSVGLIVAAVNAIERELVLTATLSEKQSLLKQQSAILELTDVGIILIDRKGIIQRTNKILRDIFEVGNGWEGRQISELIDADIDFVSLLADEVSLNDHEISVRIGTKHTHLRVSTALIRSDQSVDAMVIRIRESKAFLKMVNKIAGSKAIYTFSDIVGRSAELLECIKLAKNAARSNSSVLILGESGTGKELFAQAIHNYSPRRKGPFVAINCGALSRELIQSELFGYEGGAFTGAKKEGNPGKFELADGGTLFLDEIGELPSEAQANLLRVLQTGEVYRLGAKYAKSIDVRVVVATNKDLSRAIRERTFRDDLFYRINIFSFVLPPLRDRVEDIRFLADLFLKRYSDITRKEPLEVSEEVYDILQRYSWPGNIRELENAIDRAIAVSEGSRITSADLPSHVKTPEAAAADRWPAEGRRTKEPGVRELEHRYLVELLRETGGNLREVARRMGVARSTVYNKIKLYRISIDGFRNSRPPLPDNTGALS
jgi:transcriptional regulator of acetoin/glycerol metabolism